MSSDRFARIQQQVINLLNEEMDGWMNDLLKGMLDPGRIMDFIKTMVIDMSQFTGMTAQTGFDPYRVLGLDKSASDDEIKRRYRELVNIFHQDKSGTPATNYLFQWVQEAYQKIMKERSRC